MQYNSSNKKKITLSRDELKYNKLLRSKEKELIKRLYHNEKQKFMKKKKYDLKNWFSSDEIKNDCDDNININKTSTYFLSNCKNLKKSLNEANQSLKPENKVESYKSLNKKYKPKLFIKAENNNKDNIFSKNNYNFSCKTSKDFFNDIEQIKKYQTIQNKNKNLIKFKKPPYLHILNEQCIRNQNE